MLLLILLLLPCLLSAEEQQVSSQTVHSIRPSRRWSGSVQTGLADTFQLTLGGIFGEGPAWQNRLTVALNNALRAGDSVSVSGWNTHDVAGGANDWTAGLSYRSRIIQKRTQVLYIAAGVERWRFPSVASGTQDWLLAYSAAYGSKVSRIPITVQSNAWTLLHSPLPKGSLAHTQVWLEHALLDGDTVKILLRHGPQHTYSWNFYGTHGNRIFRYAGAVVLSWSANALEGGFRQQAGLQPGIPDNRYWSVTYTRNF